MSVECVLSFRPISNLKLLKKSRSFRFEVSNIYRIWNRGKMLKNRKNEGDGVRGQDIEYKVSKILFEVEFVFLKK